jgi:hypothetical protein
MYFPTLLLPCQPPLLGKQWIWVNNAWMRSCQRIDQISLHITNWLSSNYYCGFGWWPWTWGLVFWQHSSTYWHPQAHCHMKLDLKSIHFLTQYDFTLKVQPPTQVWSYDKLVSYIYIYNYYIRNVLIWRISLPWPSTNHKDKHFTNWFLAKANCIALSYE